MAEAPPPTAPPAAPPGRLGWLDLLKGAALIWVFWNHVAERTMGCPMLGNPNPGWPSLAERVAQLAPLSGHGLWNVPINVFRVVGWLGDQGVGLFLLLSGFGLAWGALWRTGGQGFSWKEFYRRRLFRIYPLWWAAHALVPVAGVLGLLSTKFSITRFLLSLAGIRVDLEGFYAFSGAWWFIGLLIQLYALFPLLWELLARWGALRLFIVTALAAGAARWLGILYFREYMDVWIRGSVFITRLPEFVLGMGVAGWMQKGGTAAVSKLGSVSWGLASLGLYLLGTALSLTWTGMTVAPILTSAGSAGVLFFLAAGAKAGSWKGILEWTGRHSYALYLMHHLIIQRVVVSGSGLTPGSLGRIFASVVLTLGTALALERGVDLLEQGILAWKKRAGVGGLLWQAGGLLVGISALLVGAELFSRRWVPTEIQDWGERPSLAPDPDLGWRLKPSRTTHLRWESYDYRVTSNALGYPGPDVAEARPPETVRILVTGDAFTSAEGVDTEEAWPRLLEARLASLCPGRRFQVLNFAITGYGPNQYAQVVDRFVPRFRPDLVIAEFFVNDFSDVLSTQEAFQQSIGFCNPDPDGVRSVLTLTNLREWMRLHVLGPQLARLRGRPDGNAFLFGGLYYVERQPHNIWTEGARRLEARMSQMDRTCKAQGARLMVASAPASVEVCDWAKLPYLPAFLDLSDSTKYDLGLPQRTLQGIADRLSVLLVDLRPPLKASKELPFQLHNMHWSRAGHRAVAEHLAGILAGDPAWLKRPGN